MTNIRVNDTRTARMISNCRITTTNTSCLLNHRCSFQISRAYYITAGKQGFLDVTVKGNEHRFKSLYKWESVKVMTIILKKTQKNRKKIVRLCAWGEW